MKLLENRKRNNGFNFVWLVIGGYLTFFFQAGNALAEIGCNHLRIAVQTMAMNLIVLVIGTLGLFVTGIAFIFGGVGTIPSLGGTALLRRNVR